MPQIGYSRTLCYAGRMLAPLIGVSTSITLDKEPERAYMNTAYLRAIQEAGGIPVLLPPQLGEAALGVLWKRLDGLRSEEHTSELQSRLHLVCRLLLEKKKDIEAP